MLRPVVVLLALLATLPGQAAEVAPVHALAMHGTPKYGPDFRHFDYVNPDAPKGGEVRLHAVGTFDNLNPFTIRGVAPTGGGMPFESLLQGSADEPFTEYGLIAESIEMPEDRSWVAFTLRPQARFHDGSPITVEDVIASFETLRTKGAPFYRLYYAAVDKVEKLAERKVRFSFKPGINRELPLIVGQMPVLPKKYWDSRKFDETTLEPPLGSGPYRIAEFEPGRYIVYERVKDYWGRDLPVNRGLYNFDRIRYDYYRDSTVALEAFKAGLYDYRVENEAKKWATAYDFPALAEGRVRKDKIEHDRPTGMQAYAYNIRRPLFQDPRVRQALAYAFDFEWTNKNLFYGQYTRTESYFSNSELASRGLPAPGELELLNPLKDQVPPEVFTKEYHPPGSDGSGNIRGNLRLAADLLKSAGWVVRDGRLVHGASGQPFDFEILLDQPVWERISLPFVKNLERLGIVATVRTVDPAQYENRERAFDYDMVVGSWGQSLSPGNEQREFWGSAAADEPGSRNVVGIRNPAVDALVDQLIAAPDRESLVMRSRALDRVLLWNHYVIPHWHLSYDRIAYWDKFGRPDKVPTTGVQFLAWWIDPAKVSGIAPVRQGGLGLIGAAYAQYPADTPSSVSPGAPLPPRTEPTPPPAAAQQDDPTAPARQAVPTPDASSPGVSWVTWIGLIVVAVLVVTLVRRRRTRL